VNCCLDAQSDGSYPPVNDIRDFIDPSSGICHTLSRRRADSDFSVFHRASIPFRRQRRVYARASHPPTSGPPNLGKLVKIWLT
jgi:hypothetical protein